MRRRLRLRTDSCFFMTLDSSGSQMNTDFRRTPSPALIRQRPGWLAAVNVGLAKQQYARKVQGLFMATRITSTPTHTALQTQPLSVEPTNPPGCHCVLNRYRLNLQTHPAVIACSTVIG